MHSGNRIAILVSLTRRAAAVACLLVLFGAIAVPGISERAAAAPAPDCGYQLGFATLRDEIVKTDGSDPVGSCRENEYHALSGDGVQWTEGGLFVWRKAANWTGFSNGKETWVEGPNGAAKRLNSERFPWENTGRPDAVSYLTSLGGTIVPPRSEVDEAIRQVYVLDAANGGATYNPYFGDLSGTNLYAVSLYPDRGIVLPGKQASPDVLRKFVVDNSDLISDPRVSVGTWFDADSGMTYVDVSATIADRQQAIDLGKKYNQISIFDLYSLDEIPTGGTGENIPNLPPVLDRLPKSAATGN
jgi:hypothetical protein